MPIAHLKSNSFDKFRIDFHEFCNFIPVVSTLTNTVALLQKTLYVSKIENDKNLSNSRYYEYLKAQDFKKDWLLFIPIANFIFSILRWVRSNPDKTIDEAGSKKKVVKQIADSKNAVLPIPIIQSANEYYFHRADLDSSSDHTCTLIRLKMENKELDDLTLFIAENDIEGLKKALTLKKREINFGFGTFKDTLLHKAYSYNRPKIVNWLLKNGASDRDCHKFGPPIQAAHVKYKDSRPRVVNELVKRYFEKCKFSEKDPHTLYELILRFIREKKWHYCDFEDKGTTPFRDGEKLVTLGLPSLSYRVNCVDLTSLFLNVAKRVGIVAESIFYHNYQSILPDEKNNRGILGNLKMFDDSNSGPFAYAMHNVVFADGFHFDLTLMCKYKDKDAVLAKLVEV